MLQSVLKTAMLGTEKSFPAKDDFPPFLHLTYEKIMASDLTIEGKFLRLATYALHIEAATASLQKNTTSLPLPPTEDFIYVEKKVNQLLGAALEKKQLPMTMYIVQNANKQQKLVSPYHIPALLSLAEKNIEFRTAILNVCGKRAQWLATFYPKWEKLFDEAANIEKLMKKEKKVVKTVMEDTLSELSRADKYAYLKNIKHDADFYAYFDVLLNKDFHRFPADFSLEIWSLLQKKHANKDISFYQTLALHLHSTVKMELMEQTNMSHQYIGITPTIARQMLDLMMDRDMIEA
jgi:Family of unknown function (DUF5691)